VAVGADGAACGASSHEGGAASAPLLAAGAAAVLSYGQRDESGEVVPTIIYSLTR